MVTTDEYMSEYDRHWYKEEMHTWSEHGIIARNTTDSTIIFDIDKRSMRPFLNIREFYSVQPDKAYFCASVMGIVQKPLSSAPTRTRASNVQYSIQFFLRDSSIHVTEKDDDQQVQMFLPRIDMFPQILEGDLVLILNGHRRLYDEKNRPTCLINSQSKSILIVSRPYLYQDSIHIKKSLTFILYYHTVASSKWNPSQVSSYALYPPHRVLKDGLQGLYYHVIRMEGYKENIELIYSFLQNILNFSTTNNELSIEQQDQIIPTTPSTLPDVPTSISNNDSMQDEEQIEQESQISENLAYARTLQDAQKATINAIDDIYGETNNITVLQSRHIRTSITNINNVIQQEINNILQDTPELQKTEPKTRPLLEGFCTSITRYTQSIINSLLQYEQSVLNPNYEKPTITNRLRKKTKSNNKDNDNEMIKNRNIFHINDVQSDILKTLQVPKSIISHSNSPNNNNNNNNKR